MEKAHLRIQGYKLVDNFRMDIKELWRGYIWVRM
jgi:hypothetical protein